MIFQWVHTCIHVHKIENDKKIHIRSKSVGWRVLYLVKPKDNLHNKVPLMLLADTVKFI